MLLFGNRRQLTKLERVGRRAHWMIEAFFAETPLLRLKLFHQAFDFEVYRIYQENKRRLLFVRFINDIDLTWNLIDGITEILNKNTAGLSIEKLHDSARYLVSIFKIICQMIEDICFAIIVRHVQNENNSDRTTLTEHLSTFCDKIAARYFYNSDTLWAPRVE